MLLRRIISSVFCFLPDQYFSYFRFFKSHRYLPNKSKAKTFNEKLFVKKTTLKYSDEYKLREMVVDRLKVRKYVTQKSDKVDLIPILWSGDSLSKSVWNSMPERFVIKANHGSQMVLIVNKNKDEFNKVKQISDKWLKFNYYMLGREWVYKNTERKLLIEDFISFDGDVPPDYKFHCFHGRVELLQIDIDRFSDRAKNLYDRDFNVVDGCLEYKNGETVTKAKNYDLAVQIAEELSVDFDYIRVDMYLVGDKIYFGELTNFPGNCNLRFKPKELDLWLGSKWKKITNIEL